MFTIPVCNISVSHAGRAYCHALAALAEDTVVLGGLTLYIPCVLTMSQSNSLLWACRRTAEGKINIYCEEHYGAFHHRVATILGSV